MTSDILRDLARAKAAFQLKAIEAIIHAPTQGMAGEAPRREGGSAPEGAPSPVRKDAPK